jgi:MFS-type transporter involved in bile tolerance (Atg22 family)
LVAVVQTWTGNPRLAVATIAVLFVIGLVGLWVLPLGRAALNATVERGV